MNLVTWIEKTGPKNVAKKLKVDVSSVCNWKTGKAFPRPERLVQIHKLSGGKVTYAEIIHHFVDANK